LYSYGEMYDTWMKRVDVSYDRFIGVIMLELS